MNDRRHPTDDDLLLFSGREMSERRTRQLRKHLEGCTACATRMARQETTFAAFLALHEGALKAQPPASPATRAKLKLRMEETRKHQRDSRSWALIGQAAALAVIVVATLLLGTLWKSRERSLLRGTEYQSNEAASPLPRRLLTPGAVRNVKLEELCASGTSLNDPPVNPSLEEAIFRKYGLSSSAKAHYAVDYLISPTLGGSASLDNLWPEPDSSTAAWDAQAKDALEDHLHQLVCQGKVPLATAQQRLSSDWIAAYKEYFHTDTPPANTAALVFPSLNPALRVSPAGDH